MTTAERDYWLKEFVNLVEPEWIEPYREDLLSGDPVRQLDALQAIAARLGRAISDDRHRWN
jgi:hypothetical protein